MDRALTIVVVVVGLLLVAVGVMYIAMPAHSLPSFFPGHVDKVPGAPFRGSRHRSKRGVAAFILAGGCFLIALETQRRARGYGRRGY